MKRIAYLLLILWSFCIGNYCFVYEAVDDSLNGQKRKEEIKEENQLQCVTALEAYRRSLEANSNMSQSQKSAIETLFYISCSPWGLDKYE